MGMYNEVFKKCPNCGSGRGYMQISQITWGFGGFDLDDPSTLLQLDTSDLRLLINRVRDDVFYCQNEDCRYSFKLGHPKDDENERQQLIRELGQ